MMYKYFSMSVRKSIFTKTKSSWVIYNVLKIGPVIESKKLSVHSLKAVERMIKWVGFSSIFKTLVICLGWRNSDWPDANLP